MRYFITSVMVLLLAGCATWRGVKEDAKDVKDWTVDKAYDTKAYIQEKTE